MADQRTYIKVHDGMPGHPKFAGLSDKAFRTIVTAWCYSSEYLTDGVIPVKAWTGLVPARGQVAVDKVTRELVEAGLVEARGEEVHLHDYLEHQRSKAQVEHVRQVRSEAGKQGGRPPKQKQNASGLLPDPESKPISKPEAEKTQMSEEEVLRTSSQSETEADDDARASTQARPPTWSSPSQASLNLASKAIAIAIGNDRPAAVRKGLIQRAARLLDDGAMPSDLPTALTEWRNTPDARISWLDYKLGDVASRREAAARPPNVTELPKSAQCYQRGIEIAEERRAKRRAREAAGQIADVIALPGASEAS